MKRLALIIIFTTSPALAWEYQPIQSLQVWQAPVQVQPMPSVNKYNPMNNSWGYEKPESVNKYNPMEKTWSYEAPTSPLKYNPMSDKWEYAE